MEGKLVPWAARKWEFSADQRTITFTIRDDVFFHDGTKVTVDDWVYRLNDLWLNPVQPGKRPPSRQPVPNKIEASYAAAISTARLCSRAVWRLPRLHQLQTFSLSASSEEMSRQAEDLALTIA